MSGGHSGNGNGMARLALNARLVRVTGVRPVGGVPHAAADDPHRAQSWDHLRVLAFGGGVDRFAFFAPAPVDAADPDDPASSDGGTAVLLELHQGRERPIVLGALLHDSGVLGAKAPDLGELADRSESVSEADHAIRNGAALFVVDHNGTILLRTDLARLQLGTAGVFRVSRGGTATDRPVSAKGLRAYGTGIEATLASLAARVSELERALAVVTTAYDATAPGSPVLRGTDAAAFAPKEATAPPVVAASTVALAAMHVPSDVEVPPL